MSVYLSWGKTQSVFYREDLIRYVANKDKIATSKLCAECQIFDSNKVKCTHPSFGCESNPSRVKPWESESVCPKKVKLS
jgi:hypothetical protein